MFQDERNSNINVTDVYDLVKKEKIDDTMGRGCCYALEEMRGAEIMQSWS